MTCSSETIDARSPQAHSAFHLQGTVNAVKSLWSTFWERRAQRATVIMLSALDDHALRDLGIGRSEISSVVYGGERKQRYQPHWE